jgi:hypothetical protein
MAAIGSLFFGRCPAAIARLVIPIIVWVAIKRAACWALAHIGKKVLKQMPALAHCDPAGSIIMEGMIGEIKTPVEHSLPAFVGPRRVSSRRMPMKCAGLANQKRPITAARLGSPSSQFITSDDGGLTTIATAKPISSFISPKSYGQGYQSPKTLIGDIDELGHRDLHNRLLRQVMGPVTAGPHRAA